MRKYYTGVGSRRTPGDVLALMERAAAWLAAGGWTLRSGHAPGADRAFERGAGGEADVYLPWAGFGQSAYGASDPGMRVLGRAVVPAGLLSNYHWLVELGIRREGAGVNQAVRKLHGRNVCQVLGHEEPVTPSKFVLCWCEERNGEPQGGTATAVRLALHHGIRVLNLWRGEDRRHVEATIAG